MSVQIKIDASDLEKFVRQVDELGNAAASDTMRERIGEVMYETIKGHFEELNADAEHHRTARALGAPPTQFYEKAAVNTQVPQLEKDGVSVSITAPPGLAQRLYGGEIKGDPLLTIPARSETYGHRAREFENLKVVMFPSGAGALVEREATTLRGGLSRKGARGPGTGLVAGIGEHAKGEEMGGLVYYWLVRQVSQAGDPSVLPDDSEILDSAVTAVQDYLDILLGRANGL
jgi:hypothetical protein